MKSKLNPFLALIVLASASHGADFYWDVNGAAANLGGTGNWSAAQVWRDGSTTGALGSWVDGNTARFSALSIVTLDQNASLTGINFGATNCEIRGTSTNTLTFSGGVITSGVSAHDITALLAGSVVFNPTAGNLGGASTFFVKADNTGLTSVELKAETTVAPITPLPNPNMIIDHVGAFGPAATPVKLTAGILNIGALASEVIGVTPPATNGSGGSLNLNAWATELAGGTIRSRVGNNTWNGPVTVSANSRLLNRGSAGVKLTLTGDVALGANTLTLSPTKDSNGIVLSGNISGTGGITQANSDAVLTSAGTAAATSTSTLAGTNTYTGPTQISVGRLNLTGTLTSAITLATGASLQGEGSTTGALNFGTTNDFFVDLTTPGAGAHFKAASINASTSTVTVKLTGASVAVTDMVVMEATGGSPISGTLANFIFNGRGSLSFNPGGTQLLLTFAPATLVWEGDQANPTFWDGVTTNWLNGITPEAFQSLDGVVFNDDASSFSVAVQGTSVEPGSITFNNSTNAYTLGGSPIVGVGSLTKSGTNKVTITNENTFSGGTTINTGTIELGDGTTANGSLGSNATLTNNGGLETNYGAAKSLSYNIGGSGTFTQKGTGTVNLTGTSTYTGDTTIALGSTLQLGNNTLTGSVAGNIVNNGTLSLNRSDASTLANKVSGTGGITKAAGALVTLTGPNTFDGPVAVSGGKALAVGSNSALGSTTGGTTVTSGRIELTNGITVTGESVSIAGSSDNFNGSLQAQADATATWAGPVTFNSVDARIGTGIGGTLILSGVLGDGTGTNLNVGAGSGGTGTVVVSGTANTYTGLTNIIRGTLQLGASNALPIGTTLDIDTVNAAENATFDLAGFNQTVAALQRSSVGGGAGTAFVTNTTGTLSTLTVNQAVSTNYGGRITGNVALIQSGAGTLTLSGPQFDHLGNTTVNGAVIVSSQITLTPTTNGTTNSIGGSGSLTLDGKLIANLATADATHGNSWPLVNVGTLTESYGAAFAFESSLGVFAETAVDSGIWKLVESGNEWTFTQSTGVLGVGPVSDPYIPWIATFFPGETNVAIIGKDADPDNDGVNNLTEFALHGTPNSGSDNGYRVVATEDTNANTQLELTLTIAVRNAAGTPTFTGTPSPTASVDGVKYTIEGSLDLIFPGSAVTETTAPTGLPVLPAGWEYRRFRLDASEGLTGKGFLRVKVESTL